MRILIFGATGQIGRALIEAAATQGWEASGRPARRSTFATHPRLSNTCALARRGAIVNAADYTAADRAESEREQAFLVNRDGACILTETAAAVFHRLCLQWAGHDALQRLTP